MKTKDQLLTAYFKASAANNKAYWKHLTTERTCDEAWDAYCKAIKEEHDRENKNS